MILAKTKIWCFCRFSSEPKKFRKKVFMRLFSKTYGNWTDVVVRWESPMKWKYDHIWIDWFLLGVRPHKQNPMGCHTPSKHRTTKIEKKIFKFINSCVSMLMFSWQNNRPYFSTNPTFKIPLKNPTSYLVEAAFWENPLLKIPLKFPLLLNKKWGF